MIILFVYLIFIPIAFFYIIYKYGGKMIDDTDDIILCTVISLGFSILWPITLVVVLLRLAVISIIKLREYNDEFYDLLKTYKQSYKDTDLSHKDILCMVRKEIKERWKR